MTCGKHRPRRIVRLRGYAPTLWRHPALPGGRVLSLRRVPAWFYVSGRSERVYGLLRLHVASPDQSHPQLGLRLPSQHRARPFEQPQTPPCQEQQPRRSSAAIAAESSASSLPTGAMVPRLSNVTIPSADRSVARLMRFAAGMPIGLRPPIDGSS
jgi:hypothetical protein